MNSGPDVHPAQAEERDPPSTPTTITLLVGAAITVVIVFAIEVLHAQYMALGTASTPAVDASLGGTVKREQTAYLEAGQVPSPAPPEQPTGWKKGKPIGAAIDEVVERYGKKGQ